jgi:hypothetical protein
MSDSIYNINETFIIEGIGGDTPIISACTAIYSNEFISCTGDTFIKLGTGVIYFNGNLYTNDNLSANTINASTYLSGGTNLFNIIQLTEITGGTYNLNSGILSLKKGNNSSVNINGINNYYTTGATLVGNVAYFNRNDSLSAYTLDLSTLIPPTTFDVFVTGGTYSNGTATFTNNTGGTFSVSGFYTGFTGGVVSGLTANTISATTYQNLPTDIRVTGGTYSNGITTFTNNTGGTFSVSGFSTAINFTGGTVTGPTQFTNGLTANTFSATTYLGLPLDVYTTGATLNNSNYQLTMTRNDGQTFGVNLGILSSDITITGGTYNINTGVVTFTNNTGGTFSVSGFSSGMTDTSITNFTYNNNRFTITDSSGGTFSANINSVTGLTSNGTISSNILSATTYQNLPIDISVTGGTYSNGITTFTNNTGGTFSVSGFYTGFTSGVVSGLTANTISATTYQNLPTDIRVTGGTYSASVSTIIFTNNTGGTFNVSGITDGGGTFSGGTVTGPTNFTNGLTANTISATTYLGLPTDIRVTGGTYSNGTAVFTNNTGGTFNVSGFSTGGTSTSSSFTGGTVSGATNFTNGLTANTISATTYQNLPTFTGFYLPLSGGTVSGGTNFTNGLTANTITNTDYINFKTSPSVPSPTGGTLYYDLSENALSYKPLTNQNDVTVNLGQESLIRIYNNLGYQINNGQVLNITGATSGIPTVALANASKLGTAFTESLAQTSGVATHDIPNGQYGFMTNFGVVRDLNTTAFTVGQEVFLSDTVDGALTNDPNNIAFTSRISTVGYCLESNATTGKILVVITNENALQSLTQQEINVLLGNTISTGVYEYTGATTASSTTINVAPMRGWLVYNTYSYATNPEVINIYYTGGTNLSLPNISSADSTYLLVNSGSTLYQQTTFPTPQQRRENIFLGKVNHPNRTSILNINNTVDYDVSPMSALRDLWSPIKLINQGIIPSPNGANLSFNTSAGTLWGNGINWANNQLSPNNVSIAAKVPASFFYRTQTGGTSSSVSVIDPRNYDVGGVITSIGAAGSDDSTNQRIYMYPTGVINVLYGQTKYTNLAAAVAAIQSETFIPYPNAESTGILIGVLSVRNDIGTDGEPLTNTNYAKFTLVSKFGESFGGTGGLSTTTLQQAYDNSTTPEIVINAILDGLTIKNGTGNDDNTTRLLEGLNTAGNTTSFIRADGYISGTTFQSNGLTATTISATTYQNLPLDIRVTGGTYSNGTTIFTNNTGGTFSVSGFSTGGTGSSIFTGGTVTGPTQFTNGITANTISATTYQNLPLDIRVTGGTFDNNYGITTFTNNTGGTFSVSGFSTTGTTLLWTAGTNVGSVAQLGGGNLSSGSYSLAEGQNTTASGDYSHAEGQNTIGNAPRAHAEGNTTIAAGDGSHSEGQNTAANGQASHAEGYYSTANGFSSHAEGGFTTASGAYSHAEGNQTTASGTASHAEGSGTTASGTASHAGGSNSIANGDYSFVHGANSIANETSTVVLGNNITGTTANTTYVDSFNIKTVGSGSSITNLGVDNSGNIVSGGTGVTKINAINYALIFG